MFSEWKIYKKAKLSSLFTVLSVIVYHTFTHWEISNDPIYSRDFHPGELGFTQVPTQSNGIQELIPTYQ